MIIIERLTDPIIIIIIIIKISPVRDSGRLLRHLNTIITAGFFPLDLGFLVSSGFKNLGLFCKITVATLN